MKMLIPIFLMIGLVSAGNWLVNGDFEEALNTGWTSTQSGSYIYIDRAITYEPDPDYEVRVEKGSGSGFATLSQTIDIT
ncbi:MAG: hypothetical protein ABIL18_03880, partial [candidate division WOR-3 bacterium]